MTKIPVSKAFQIVDFGTSNTHCQPLFMTFCALFFQGNKLRTPNIPPRTVTTWYPRSRQPADQNLSAFRWVCKWVWQQRAVSPEILRLGLSLQASSTV